jgi:ATP-dependent helicase/nuclease subunit A
MSNAHDLVDGAERLMAETTFDRNVVVVAGAGTGKTTLLVNRILHALVREPHPVRLLHLVALTFTNKAAHEMKMRLRECLRLLLTECEGGGREGLFSHPSLATFQQAYHLSSDVIRQRILVALEDLDKSHIRTLHSFAASVLRLYPLEAGVNPNFQEDEGDRFDAIFKEVWDRWLEYELGLRVVPIKVGSRCCKPMTLSEVRDFARVMASCGLLRFRMAGVGWGVSPNAGICRLG